MTSEESRNSKNKAKRPKIIFRSFSLSSRTLPHRSLKKFAFGTEICLSMVVIKKVLRPSDPVGESFRPEVEKNLN